MAMKAALTMAWSENKSSLVTQDYLNDFYEEFQAFPGAI